MQTEAQQYHHHYEMLAISGMPLNRFAYKGFVIEQQATGYYVNTVMYNRLALAKQAIDTAAHAARCGVFAVAFLSVAMRAPQVFRVSFVSVP